MCVCMYVWLFYCNNIIVGAVAVRLTVDTGFKQTSDLVWYNKIQCSGNENRLIDCPASSEQQTCTGIAGVKCANKLGMYDTQ